MKLYIQLLACWPCVNVIPNHMGNIGGGGGVGGGWKENVLSEIVQATACLLTLCYVIPTDMGNIEGVGWGEKNALSEIILSAACLLALCQRCHSNQHGQYLGGGRVGRRMP